MLCCDVGGRGGGVCAVAVGVDGRRQASTTRSVPSLYSVRALVLAWGLPKPVRLSFDRLHSSLLILCVHDAIQHIPRHARTIASSSLLPPIAHAKPNPPQVVALLLAARARCPRAGERTRHGKPDCRGWTRAHCWLVLVVLRRRNGHRGFAFGASPGSVRVGRRSHPAHRGPLSPQRRWRGRRWQSLNE